jgi:hypothetical protein
MYITYLYVFREGKGNGGQRAIFDVLSVLVVHRSWLRPADGHHRLW